MNERAGLAMSTPAKNHMDFPDRMFALGTEYNVKVGDLSLAGWADDEERDINPYALGGKRSWVPVLGEIVWELPKETAARIPFSAHICQLSDGRQIGYVRVPHYEYNKESADEFGKLIARFESTTEAMVIDQVNNPGGSLFQMYAMLSYLTDRPLALPMHQITIISDEDVAIAREKVALAEAGEAEPPDMGSSQDLVAYYRFVLSEFQAGRGRREKPTNPVHLFGVAEVLPAEVHYTKKIVVLINEVTFSAPEFFAAILQDNKRATLFGKPTPGAGGCAKRFVAPFSEELGIEYYTFRWTLAWRTNGQPIEGIGVHPDVRYSITVEDLQSNYAGYRRALMATITA